MSALRAGVLALGLVFAWTPAPAAAQEPPAPAPAPSVVVDADEVVYDESTAFVTAAGHVRLTYRSIKVSADYAEVDLRTEVIRARGHVVVIDPDGRELRGDVLVYDVRAGSAAVAPAAAFVNGVHTRSARGEWHRDRIVSEDTTLTTCDPDRPLYRITASRVEAYPGDRVVAYNASLWLGRYHLFTVPTYVIWLRSREESARSFPRAGYDAARGWWVDYWYFIDVGRVAGRIAPLLGTRTSGIELALTPWDGPLGSLPLEGRLLVFDGWYRQVDPVVDTVRLGYALTVRAMPLQLDPSTRWEGMAGWRETWYGTGDRLRVREIDTSVTHRFEDVSSVRLSYDLRVPEGVGPLAMDAIDPDDTLHRVRLQFTQTTVESISLSTTVRTWLQYNYLLGTTSATIGYGARSPDRYHWGLEVEYTIDTQVVRLSPDLGIALGTSTYLTVQAIYNTTTAAYDDLDYILRVAVCDCIDITLKYRQMRDQFSVTIGLTAFR